MTIIYNKKEKMTYVDRDIEKLSPLYTADENVKSHEYCG